MCVHAYVCAYMRSCVHAHTCTYVYAHVEFRSLGISFCTLFLILLGQNSVRFASSARSSGQRALRSPVSMHQACTAELLIYLSI